MFLLSSHRFLQILEEWVIATEIVPDDIMDDVLERIGAQVKAQSSDNSYLCGLFFVFFKSP